jgi:hypothetical protein
MKYWIPVALAVFSLVCASAASAQEAFEEYTVEEGDTCTSIARQFYGDARAYDHIHEHNDLSDHGYACRPGMTLRLPVLPDQPEAQLTARAGNVRAKSPEASWDPVEVGAELFSAWRVNTLERSRAELGFRDSSQLQMTENTLVVIYGPSKASARRTVARRATVEKGRLKSKLAALSGQKVDVETPDAKATLESGRAQVTVDEGESRVANHDGKPVAVTDVNGSGAVSVNAGQGTRVRKGKPPEKPRPLPSTPQWTQSFSPRALVVAGASATVGAEWKPVSGAEHYYVEVTRSRRQIDVLFSKRVPASIHSLEMRGLPPGDYFVSIVAIDADEFESIPSKLRRLRVLELGARASHVLDAETSQIMLGGTLRAPGGMRCAIEGGEPAEVLQLTSEGAHDITCEGDDGSLATTVEVVKPTMRVSGPSAGDIAVRQGAMSAVDVRFEPGLPPDVVALVPEQTIDARPLQVGPDRVRVNLTAGRDATPGPSTVELYYRDVLLGSFEVAVEPAEPARPVATDSQPEAEYLLSAMVGYDAVGADPYWGAGFPSAGTSAEVGLGTAPTRHFAAEARAGAGLHSGERLETVVTLRAQAFAGWFDSALAPHAGLGVSWQGVLDGDARFSPRASLGVMPSLGQRFRLRGEVGVDVTPVGGAIRFLPEARLGAALRF